MTCPGPTIPTYRRILVALSLDEEAILVEVPKHGPVVLTASMHPNAHVRLRELVLEPTIPHRKSEPTTTNAGDWFAELGRQISELGTDEGEPEALPPDPKYRRIVVALTVDGDALLVEVPGRAPALLRDDRTFARLRELLGDMSIASTPIAASFNPRNFFRGVVRGIGELGKDDKPPT